MVESRLAEENEAKQLLMRMDKAGADDPQFPANLTVLRAAVTAHARAEEHRAAPNARLRGRRL
ncbi:hypothetical protein ACQPYK_20445 [Streptosporangium sp. CA-135522]|uniref:hypothetical protein n=1 Tax=Streptosporangium sp. CA-135522 TaxID=3240072 RepID=UPI003D94A636